MKKLCIIYVTFILAACGHVGNNTQTGNNADSSGKTNNMAGDSTKHPTGMDNSSVISTDTAAINVQNSIKKADSIKGNK